MKKNIIYSIVTSTLVTIIIVLIMGFVLPNKLNLDKNYSITGGVIRNTSDSWFLINNSGHEPINISSVETTDISVILHYKKFNKVVSFNVTPDETMASEGYTMGASVGLDKTIISIYDSGKKLVNPKTYRNKDGNIWVNGIFRN